MKRSLGAVTVSINVLLVFSSQVGHAKRSPPQLINHPKAGDASLQSSDSLFMDTRLTVS
jgi:hypothetical protein